MINVIFTLLQLLWIEDTADPGLFSNRPEALCEDHKFMAGNIVSLNCLPNDLFRDAVGIHVCGVPGVEAAVIGRFEEGE